MWDTLGCSGGELDSGSEFIAPYKRFVCDVVDSILSTYRAIVLSLAGKACAI